MLELLMAYWKIAGQKDKNQELLLLPYLEFVEFLKNQEGITDTDTRLRLTHLKDKSLVSLKKDGLGKIYISFSPQVFKYFNIL